MSACQIYRPVATSFFFFLFFFLEKYHFCLFVFLNTERDVGI